MRVETIGDATLYCGDCLEILPTLGKVDAVVTDPPYGMLRFETDTKSFLEVVGPALRLSWGFVSNPGNMFVFMSTAEIVSLANAVGINPKRVFWMYKPADMTYPLGGWLLTSEAIIWFAKGDRLALRQVKPLRHDCYTHTRVGKEGVEGHPTVKPLWVVQDIVSRCDAETILDPFMGSGTTGVACMNLGRKFIGIEIEPKYFDIACRRIEDAWASRPRLFDESESKPVQTELIEREA